MTRALIILCFVACGGHRTSTKDEVRTRLEQVLRQEQGREAVTAAAREYREQMAEEPDALRLIAGAFERIGDRPAAIETLRTLIVRGQATSADRYQAIDILLTSVSEDRAVLDDATYRTNLEWMQREQQRQRECRRAITLARWAQGHPEELATNTAALDVCKQESRRADLFRARANLTKDPNDACQAVVHGDPELAQRCVDAGSGWRVEVAKAVLGQDAQAHLKNAIISPDVTSYVLTLFARTPNVAPSDACRALARAQDLELRSADDAANRSATIGRFEGLKRDRGCT